MNYSGARSEAPDLIEDIEDWLGVWLEERVLPLVGSLGIAGDAQIFHFFFYFFISEAKYAAPVLCCARLKPAGSFKGKQKKKIEY